jgi:raffinose/stachyose/melibiose transport system permease protein
MTEIVAHAKGPTVPLPFGKTGWTVVMAVFALLWNFPPLLTVITSLKSAQEILAHPFAPPSSLNLQSLIDAWQVLSYSQLFSNSLLYAAAGSALAVVLALVPALAFSWFPIPGRALLFVLLLTTQMLPQQTVIIPLFTLLRSIGLLDTRLGLIIVHGAYGMPFLLLVLTGFIGNIPKELGAAARIDGCSDFNLLRYVIIPLIRPAIAVGFTINFMGIWKEYFFALILQSSSELMPVSVGILSVSNEQYFTSLNLPAAAIVLSQFPIVVLYIFAYRWITRGLYAGSVKG